MKLKLNGIEFDSAVGEITIGDMERIEQQGVDMSALAGAEKIPIATIRILADMCLRKCVPDLPADFVANIPMRNLGQLSEYIRDFFVREQRPGGGES